MELKLEKILPERRPEPGSKEDFMGEDLRFMSNAK
jgi:hypothetical protein